MAVAHDVLDEFLDGVFLVMLASISDPNSMPRTVVRALNIQEVGPQSALGRLKYHLRDKQMLLLLDNFEQILAAAPYVAELLAACPFVKILVTSRAPLRIRRERQFPVSALALPDLKRFPKVDVLPDYAAVELFLERAQSVKPNFSLTPENAQPVVAICHRLDGLPLAIELLSAWVKLLPPVALLERMRGRLMLHSDGLRDLELRHRTLNAAIGWSYDLLDGNEKTLFMRLGVFVGGCTVEAVEIICQPEISVLDGMASLLDKNLLQQKDDTSSEPRFMLLETIREYALERLDESGESPEIQRRHASFFLKLAKTPRGTTAPALPEALWLSRMDQEYDNVRTALDWCFTSEQTKGVALATLCVGYWIARGRLEEGRFWLEKYLEAFRSGTMVLLDSQRELLNGAAVIAYFLDDLVAMRQHTEELLELAQERQDEIGLAYVRFYRGLDALQQNDLDRANSVLEEGLALSRQAGNSRQVASILHLLGLVALGQKDYTRAFAFNTESLILDRQFGNLWAEASLCLNNGGIWEAQGDYEAARIWFSQCARISLEIGDTRMLSMSLEGLARLIGLAGEYKRATRIMGAMEALRDSISVPIEPLFRSDHERWLTQMRMNLDEAAFAAAWAEGRLMTLEQAVEYALVEG